MRTEHGFKAEPYQFLSNMTPCVVSMYGVIYPSVENAYQASKCLHAKDRLQFVDISPHNSKKLWRRLGNTVEQRPDFHERKLDFMKVLLQRKFSDTNPILKQQLIATGDIELVEVNWWRDTFWGECNGVGENNLGKLLMQIRTELQQQNGSFWLILIDKLYYMYYN